ncbi:rhoptry kinase family protein rop11 (incomplete catalytic triad) [Cystoisospora suis]|uniref:non-specific serine/threonine protein kinase n=1 Tax=Cystoisospora suis TaxID=483139 RepID=A0A2C6KVP4_9APIC|nr:rhoptry kinase family protein rop11 (incomplete catalytic triad) [Cystoisospora suis]
MSLEDEHGRRELGEQCLLLERSDVAAQGSLRLMTLLDEAIPENTRLKIRILSSDQMKDIPGRSPSALSSAWSSALHGTARGEQEGGSDDEDLFVIFRRGRVLGTGAEAVVVEGDFLGSRGSSLSSSRAEPGVGRSETGQGASERLTRNRTRQKRLRERQLGPVTTSAREFRKMSLRERKHDFSEEAIQPRRVALRFVVSRPMRPSKIRQGEVPFAREEEINACILKLRLEQEKLLDIARSFGGSDYLKDAHGLVFPTMIGQLEGYPSTIHETGRAPRKRLLLNFVTISPLMKGTLGMLQENDSLSFDARVYGVKSLIKLMAHLDLLGLVHRDLSFSNILIDGSGKVHLVDFQYVVRRHERFPCGDIVSGSVTEPSLAMCMLHFPERQVIAHHASDVWMAGMIAFMWLCRDFPFDGMIYDTTGGQDLLANVKVLASLYDPSIASSEHLNQPFPAPIDWDKCKTFPIAHYPDLKDAIQGLLDINPQTRSRPYDMITSHPLFRTGGVTPEAMST